MKIVRDGGAVVDLGTTEATPTIGIVDYSRRETDDFGVTTVVERSFSRRMAVRCALPTDEVDAVQRLLADIRATPVQWIADDRFAWLNLRGFYKDFDLDLAVPPLSYCTLTVEGLAATEPFADPGSDPAPDDTASTLRLLQPTDIGTAQLVASSVAPDDAPAWSAQTNYPLGARVIKAPLTRIYESAVANNVGHDPAAASGHWTDVGPMNRWAMFDRALGSVTIGAGSIAVTLAAGPADAVALLDVAGATVRVQAPGYDRTLVPTAGGMALFLDLPLTNGQVTVTVDGTGTVGVGTLLVGQLRGLGITEAAPSAGITDYSRKEIDDFGEVTIVERAWAKRMAAKALIDTDAVDLVASRIASVRARPVLWIGGSAFDSLTIYGFFKEFSIEVGHATSKLSFTVEGLSTAGKVEPLRASVPWPDVTDPLGTKPDDNADVTAENTSKDTAAVGGVPAAQVNDRIQAARDAIDAIGKLTTENIADIDALVETYGETASAAASAGAAKASEDNAKAAATNSATARDLAVGAKTAAEAAQTTADQKARDAAQSATSASGFATTASGQATIATQKADAAGQSASTATAQANIATTKAGEASASANQAATSETSAAGSSNSASSSATVSAKSASAATLAADFPLTFAQKGALYRSGTWGGGVPIPDSDFVAGTSGNVYKVGGVYGLAYVRPIPSKGRLLRYQARIRAVGADASLSTDFEYGNSPAGPPAGGTFSGFRSLTVAAGWTDIEYLIDGRAANWAWAYVMPRLRGTAGTGGTVEVEYFRAVDITDQQVAADYAAASATSAATAGTKANDAGISAAAALTSETNAETAAGSAATSASQASTSETNAAGSASTASSAQAVTSSIYQSALKATGDQEFVNGVDGYEIVAYGALTDVTVIAAEYGRSNLIANKPGKRVGLVSKRRYPITSSTQKFVLAASARLAAGPSGSDFYIGYLMFDAAGNRIQGAGLGNYPLFSGYAFANNEWVDREATIGQADLTGAQLINPAAVSFAPAVFINDRNQNATAIYEVDYLTVRDVSAEVAANAAASSAATAGTKATEAGQSASAAQTSATSAQTFAKNSSDSAKAANDSFTSAQAFSTAAGQYAQSASGSANAASTSAGNAKASADASIGSAAVATDKAAQAASSATLAASYSVGAGNFITSDFASGLAGWKFTSNVARENFFWGVDNVDFTITGEHYQAILQHTRDGAHVAESYSEWVAVQPDEWWQASAWIASRECTSLVYLQWGDASGNPTGPLHASAAVGNEARGSSTLGGFKRVWAKGKAPATARYARFIFHKNGWQPNPPNDLSWGIFTRPMLARATETQTEPSPYVPRGGGAGLADAAARIEETALVAASAGSAVAQVKSILKADTLGQNASLTEMRQVAADTIAGVSGALWKQVAVAGNARVQMSLYAIDQNGQVRQGVDIIGDLTLSGNLVVSGSIITDKIGLNQMTATSAMSQSGNLGAEFSLVHAPRNGESTLQITVSGIVDVPAGSSIRALGDLYIAGVLVASGVRLGKNNQSNTYSLTRIWGGANAPVWVTLRTRQEGTSPDGPGYVDCTIVITELKR